MVLSPLNYCDVVYGSSIYNSDANRIQRLQNSCLRLIFGVRKYDHISHKLREVSWLNMSNRRKLHAVTLYFKVLTYKAPQYLYKKIEFRSDVHNLNIRFKGTLTPPLHKTEMFKRSFSYNITRCINSSPVGVGHRSVLKFRRDFFSYLLSEQLLSH